MKFLLLTLALASVSASAAIVTKGQSFDSYSVFRETEAPVLVKVRATLKTSDTCNGFALNGGFQKVESDSYVKTYLGSFHFIGTLMACPPGPVKEVVQDSEWFEIKPEQGTVYATFLIPSGWELLVK